MVDRILDGDNEVSLEVIDDESSSATRQEQRIWHGTRQYCGGGGDKTYRNEPNNNVAVKQVRDPTAIFVVAHENIG